MVESTEVRAPDNSSLWLHLYGAMMAAMRALEPLCLIHHCSSAEDLKATGAVFVVDEEKDFRTAGRAFTLFP